MTAKHFSEYQKRFLGRSNPYKTGYLENSIFEILGHSDLKTRFWNFDPQNRPLRSSQKLKIPFLGKIVKSIFLGQFFADLGIWGVKRRRRAFLTFSSLNQVKIRFRDFFTAKIRFFRFFDSQNVKKHHFSNRRNGVRVSKNHDFSKTQVVHIFQAKSYGESIAKLRKMIGALENGVSSTFW